jgi:hypothetical protein
MSSQNINIHGTVSLQHFLTVIFIVAPLGVILLLLITILLLFAPRGPRRRPLFILNIIACVLGICQAVFFACLNSYVILHPDKPVSHTIALAAIAILLGPPIFIDSISFIRLLAFYPIRLTAPSTLFAVVTPTFVWKAARLACLTAFLVTYPATRFNGPGSATLPGLVWDSANGHWTVALLALQVADNSYASHLSAYTCTQRLDFGRFVSAMFLYKLYQYGLHKPEVHGRPGCKYFISTRHMLRTDRSLFKCVLPLPSSQSCLGIM